MSKRQVKRNRPATMGIPIEFGTDVPLYFPIKIQPQILTHIPSQTPVLERSLIPALFQIAACANDVKSMSALKSALRLGQTPLAEMVLDPRRLEVILKAAASKKK
jgi:hypothetical protein